MSNKIFNCIQEKSSILVIGSPRSEKSIFIEKFMLEKFRKGKKILYIITNEFPEDFIDELNKMSNIGNFHIEKNLIKIIDCYTNFIGIPKENDNLNYRVPSPGSLNEISIALTKAINEFSPSYVILDSASTILLQSPGNLQEKFFQIIAGKSKIQSTFIILLEEGLHDLDTIKMLEALTEVTIQFSEKKGIKYIEIIKKTGHERIPYEFDKDKQVFEEMLEAKL